MKKKFLFSIGTAIACVSVFQSMNQGSYASQSDLLMTNVEALALQTETEHLYALVDKRSMEVVDDKTGESRKIITIYCEGTGSEKCA